MKRVLNSIYYLIFFVLPGITYIVVYYYPGYHTDVDSEGAALWLIALYITLSNVYLIKYDRLREQEFSPPPVTPKEKINSLQYQYDQNDFKMEQKITDCMEEYQYLKSNLKIDIPEEEYIATKLKFKLHKELDGKEACNYKYIYYIYLFITLLYLIRPSN